MVAEPWDGRGKRQRGPASDAAEQRGGEASDETGAPDAAVVAATPAGVDLAIEARGDLADFVAGTMTLEQYIARAATREDPDGTEVHRRRTRR